MISLALSVLHHNRLMIFSGQNGGYGKGSRRPQLRKKHLKPGTHTSGPGTTGTTGKNSSWEAACFSPLLPLSDIPRACWKATDTPILQMVRYGMADVITGACSLGQPWNEIGAGSESGRRRWHVPFSVRVWMRSTTLTSMGGIGSFINHFLTRFMNSFDWTNIGKVKGEER